MPRRVVALLVTAGLALAPLAARSADAMPAVREQAGVNYVSGGIGLDERAQLEALGTELSLRLTFALDTGSFLSDIPVRVVDGSGRVVIEATSEGPIFFAGLAPGVYTVEVGPPGEEQRRTVRIVAGRQTEASFFWRALAPGEDSGPLPTPGEAGGGAR